MNLHTFLSNKWVVCTVICFGSLFDSFYSVGNNLFDTSITIRARSLVHFQIWDARFHVNFYVSSLFRLFVLCGDDKTLWHINWCIYFRLLFLQLKAVQFIFYSFTSSSLRLWLKDSRAHLWNQNRNGYSFFFLQVLHFNGVFVSQHHTFVFTYRPTLTSMMIR